MQQIGCEDIRILISRFVDDEVTSAERERVEAHVAACDACAYKLVELMEMAVLFAETPLRRPDPELRTEVFGEISRRKEAARRVEDLATSRKKERPWYLPSEPEPAPIPPFHVRLMRAASPFAMAAVALFFLLGALALGGWPRRDIQEPKVVGVPPGPLPTRYLPSDVPLAVGTSVVTAQGTGVIVSVGATATLAHKDLIKLAQPKPVLEEATAITKTGWHVVRDASYGYTIHYPPNWWTQVQGSTRYFYPWSEGGTQQPPYWIDLRVLPNSMRLTAATANEPVCEGKCEQVATGGNTPSWLRREYTDRGVYHDEGYLFDSDYIYQLRLSVPDRALPADGGYQERLQESQPIFSLMSGRIVLAGSAEDDPAYGGVLFLNGTDLWVTRSTGGGGNVRVTSGAGVRRFAQSPDLSRVAYTASNDQSDVWGRRLYLAHIVSGGPETPMQLASNMDLQDIAWYGDRVLLALARDGAEQLGLYKFTVPDSRYSADDVAVSAVLITKLSNNLTGARALSVSPDRQLITFLAPVGPDQGTDLYAVRPDGTGLTVLVRHDDPLSPVVDGQRALAPQNQALKDYVWADGHLEAGGYSATILFTCGNSSFPNWILGGYLVSTSNFVLDPEQLMRVDARELQIVHLAYSSNGKVAFTGYMNDRNGRADQLMGLWTADVVRGAILNPRPMPAPDSPNGVTDLQWSPDGTSLIYRETVPYGPTIRSARYDSVSGFRIVRLDVGTGQAKVLFESPGHTP